MIKQDTIDKVIGASNIVELIGETVSLTKKGKYYVGKCPFHNGKYI